MIKDKRVAVIIPFYDGEAFIEECVSSILQSSFFVEKIYIIDNSTTRIDLGFVMELSDVVHIIKTKRAIGFGRACNVGISKALSDGFDVGIIMNQDARFDINAIGLLVSALDPKTFGSVPVSFVYDFSYIHQDVYNGYLSPVKNYQKDRDGKVLQKSYLLTSRQANGSCVAFNLRLLSDKAWFDPNFLMYGEDVDLFKRYIDEEKLELRLVPNAKIGHKHSQISDTENKNKIDAYGRFGGQVMLLKESASKKLFIKTIHTYVTALIHFNFDLMFRYFLSDILFLQKIRMIKKSRDSNFLKKRVSQFIQDDQKRN